MFERWSRVMGGIFTAAGIPGFLGNLLEFYEVADGEGAQIRAFLCGWWSKHRGDAVTVSELFGLATSEDSTLDLEAKTEQGRRVKLGQLLSQLRDRQYTIDADLRVRVIQDGTRHRAGVWRLADVDGESGESGESHRSRQGDASVPLHVPARHGAGVDSPNSPDSPPPAGCPDEPEVEAIV
jgi:hypothetical protein